MVILEQQWGCYLDERTNCIGRVLRCSEKFLRHRKWIFINIHASPPLDPILSPRISSKQFRVHCQSVLDEYMHLCINETHRAARRIKAATLVKILQWNTKIVFVWAMKAYGGLELQTQSFISLRHYMAACMLELKDWILKAKYSYIFFSLSKLYIKQD